MNEYKLKLWIIRVAGARANWLIMNYEMKDRKKEIKKEETNVYDSSFFTRYFVEFIRKQMFLLYSVFFFFVEGRWLFMFPIKCRTNIQI